MVKKIIAFCIFSLALSSLAACAAKPSEKQESKPTAEENALVNDAPPFVDHLTDRMERDWFDGNGVQIWKGLPPDQLRSVTRSERERFEKLLFRIIDCYSEITDSQKDIGRAEGSLFDTFSYLCLQYDQTIPFTEGGRHYGKGFDACPDGFDNRFWESRSLQGFGLDAEGYIIWLFRNTFGRTPCDMEDLYSISKASASIQVDDLQIGDVGMTNGQPGPNHYGVVAGFLDGTPIFSHCDNTYSDAFPLGSNRLSYLASLKNEYYGDSAPVDFQFFFRIAANWGGLE